VIRFGSIQDESEHNSTLSVQNTSGSDVAIQFVLPEQLAHSLKSAAIKHQASTFDGADCSFLALSPLVLQLKKGQVYNTAGLLSNTH